MPLYDWKCPTCGRVFEKVVVWDYEANHATPDDPEAVMCMICHVLCERLPAAPAFVVRGFNAKNGYSGGK